MQLNFIIIIRGIELSYNLYIIDQKTGNRNTWHLNVSELMEKTELFIKSLNQSEIIIIEKRD